MSRMIAVGFISALIGVLAGAVLVVKLCNAAGAASGVGHD